MIDCLQKKNNKSKSAMENNSNLALINDFPYDYDNSHAELAEIIHGSRIVRCQIF